MWMVCMSFCFLCVLIACVYVFMYHIICTVLPSWRIKIHVCIKAVSDSLEGQLAIVGLENWYTFGQVEGISSGL